MFFCSFIGRGKRKKAEIILNPTIRDSQQINNVSFIGWIWRELEEVPERVGRDTRRVFGRV